MTLDRTPVVRSATALAGSVLLLGGLVACGGGGSDGDATDSAARTAPTAAASGAAGRQLPGTSGLVADVSGRTLQVQGQLGQTAVTYSDATVFRAQVAATLDDVTVGSCVMVTPATSSSASADGSDDTSRPTTIAAGSVRITAATDGSCTRGGGPGGSGRPSGRPTDLPSDLPNDRPSDGPAGRAGFGAFGTVSAVSADGFTVAQQQPDADGASAATTTSVTVTVSGSTTYTSTEKTDASSVKAGVCVTATGQADDTGAVSAESIAVSQPVDGECGFGGVGRGAGTGTGTQS